MYALCEVKYEGRAVSTIGPGRRLIFYKQDGSLIIHGACKTVPINYSRAGAILEVHGDSIVSTTKTEKIIVKVLKIEHYEELHGWSTANVEMRGTEAQMCKHIINNAEIILGVSITEIHNQYQTPAGPIDLVFKDSCGILHCIEAKRKKAATTAVYQLHRYMQFFDDHAIGYLAAPDIGVAARRHLSNFEYRFLKVSEW